MAGEFTLSASFSFDKNGEHIDTRDMDLDGQSFDMSGTYYIERTVLLSTSQVALDIGSITTCGWIIVKNRGSVTIHIRNGSSGTNVVSIPAGAGFPFYLATSTPYALTASSTARLQYKLFEA